MDRAGRWAFIPMLLVVALLTASPSAAAAQVTDADVNEAIDRMVEALWEAQNEQGHWDRLERDPDDMHTHGANWGGTSALAVYALIAAGESHQQPDMARALDVLERMDLRGTYARALRAHVWAALPPHFESHLRRDVEWLLEAAHDNRTEGIAFDYSSSGRGWSNSRTQYGVLGLWEGAKRGVPIPNEAWSGLLDHFVFTQNADGSWPYSSGERHNSTTAMTCAALTALYVAQEYLHAGDFREVGRTPEHPLQQYIERGLSFLNNHYRPDSDDPGRGRSHLGYYLYGVERVGLASGIRYFNDMDWFATGAQHIIEGLTDGGFAFRSGHVHHTSFSLLFMVRGRVPVFVNKLEVPSMHWNNRPRDLANLTAWASDETERQMMWQRVPFDTEPETWLESPLLYLASHQALDLSEEQEARLKRFIDLGGMLITTADDDSSEFSESVGDLLSRLYPDYALEPIEPEDDLFNLVYQLDSTADGLSPQSVHNGVRHLAVHIPHDISWTLHSNDRSNPAPWELITNAFFYATERGRSRARLDAHFLEAQAWLAFRDGEQPAAGDSVTLHDGEDELTLTFVTEESDEADEDGSVVLGEEDDVATTLAHLAEAINDADLRIEAAVDAEATDPTLKLTHADGRSAREIAVSTSSRVVHGSGGEPITIGRAVYDGNHDPEPLAWEVQGNFMYNAGKARVTVEYVQLDALPDPSDVPFVHVVGTEEHAFSSAEMESIREFVEAGGLLLFENAGGRGEFATSANEALTETFEQRLRPISSQSPLVTGEAIDGFDISQVRYRPFTTLRMGPVRSPRLLAMTFDDEVRVIVSPEDVTKAMLNQPVWSVFGYHSESAQQIVANLALGSAAEPEERIEEDRADADEAPAESAEDTEAAAD